MAIHTDGDNAGKISAGAGRILIGNPGLVVTDTEYDSTQLYSGTGGYNGSTNFGKGEYWILSIKMETDGSLSTPWLQAEFIDSDNHQIIREFALEMHTQEMWLSFTIYTGRTAGTTTPYLRVSAGDESVQNKTVTLYQTRLL